jgi:hypothetical protein
MLQAIRTSFLFALTLCSPGSAATLLRVACGGAGGTDQTGALWQPDADFSGGALWTTADNQDVPYRNLRYGISFSYTFQFQPGNFSVILKFIEPNKTGSGQRLFRVSINGTTVLNPVDLFAVAPGALAPKDYTLPVSSPTGRLQIVFTSITGNAVVSGIQINEAPPPMGTPGYLTGLESAMPSPCLGPLVFYTTTDTNDLFWCSTLGPWKRIGGQPLVESLEQCSGSGSSIDPLTKETSYWNCAGIWRIRIRRQDGSILPIIGSGVDITAGPGATWTDMLP